MHLHILAAKFFVRRVMISLGSRVSCAAAALPRTSQPSFGGRLLPAQHVPWTAVCSSRSLATTRVSGPLLPASLAGWPNIPLHLQRKVLAWSRTPNAEEAVAALPAALSDAPAAAVSDGGGAATPSSGAAAFSLNGSSSVVADAAGASAAADSVVAGQAAAAGAMPPAAASTPSVEDLQAAAEQNGNGVAASAAPSTAPPEAVAVDSSAAASSSSNGRSSADPGAAGQGAAAEAAAVAATAQPSLAAPAAAQEAVQQQPAAAAGGDSPAAPIQMDSTEAATAEVVIPASDAATAAADTEAAPSSDMAPEAAACVAAGPSAVSVSEAEEAAAAESIAAEAAAAAEAEAQIAMAAASSSDASSTGSDAAPPSSSSSDSSASSSSSSGFGGPAVRLVLSSGAAMLPHPDKASRGGEDSFFIADHQAAVGVADGVGGWAEIGVDAGAYARLLMVHAKEAADAAAEEVANGTLSAQAILESAFYRTNVQGSSTACVLVVNGTTLSASNLGDSGFVLVRDGVATFQCPQQQHNFNFPFQLGSADSMSDQPQAAMRFELQLQPGDIIVTGSDGLWDNIFAEEAATIASKCRDKGETATTAAQVLCRYARMRASDAKYHSPFSYAAIQAGYVYLGGKMDDITVVCSYVQLPSRV